MKKQDRKLVVRRETLQQLARRDLEVVAGAAPWSQGVTNCPLTKNANGKTCVSFEFC